MSHSKIYLMSDNWAPAHPEILKSVMDANTDSLPSYGADRWTEQALETIQKVFQKQARVFFVPTGTGANVFAIKLACRPHESIICTDIAHIHYQESGAIEANVGCKILTVSHKEGKITCEAIQKILRKERAFGKHSTAPRILSISQPTEVGTIYSLEELTQLSLLCKRENLLFHMDGSRLYNAAASLNLPLKSFVEAASLDLLSLGGTKNGLMCAEALLIFNPLLENGSDHLQKQTLQLCSKMRYLAAQFIPFFEKELWLTLAKHANQQASKIAAIIARSSKLCLNYPVMTNQIFFSVATASIPLIQEKVFCHLWNQEKNEIRLITSWNTTDEEIVQLEKVLADYL